ncbi:GGDEF domain-containing protein [Nocardia niigatensis]
MTDHNAERPTAGDWLSQARLDPTTGLLAFADFRTDVGRHLVEAANAGHSVGVAIGDVDGLKEHMQNRQEGDLRGHLAGHALMERFGELTACWFRDQGFTAGAAAAFGGDELIIAAVVDGPGRFVDALTKWQADCRHWLPCTVSIAYTLVTADYPPFTQFPHAPQECVKAILTEVDRALFTGKASRAGADGQAFLTGVDLGMEGSAKNVGR